MKTTLAPSQISAVEETMLTVGATDAVITMEIPLLVTVGVVVHALEVSVQVTISPLANVVDVKVGLLVPTFVPFTFH